MIPVNFCILICFPKLHVVGIEHKRLLLLLIGLKPVFTKLLSVERHQNLALGDTPQFPVPCCSQEQQQNMAVAFPLIPSHDFHQSDVADGIGAWRVLWNFIPSWAFFMNIKRRRVKHCLWVFHHLKGWTTVSNSLPSQCLLSDDFIPSLFEQGWVDSLNLILFKFEWKPGCLNCFSLSFCSFFLLEGTSVLDVDIKSKGRLVSLLSLRFSFGF